MKIKHEATIDINHNTTFSDIKKAVEGAQVPDVAKIAVSHYPGDQRDPGYTKITFKWET